MVLCQGLLSRASTRKIKPIWILMEQEALSASGISWAICKSAPRPSHSSTPPIFYRLGALSAAQPTISKHYMWLAGKVM